MKKLKIFGYIFGIGLATASIAISTSSAQSAYRERVLMQRQSLLGQMSGIIGSWFAGLSLNATAPVRGGIYTGPVARPFTGGASSGRGPVGSGGSCASCNPGYDLQNGNCVAIGQCKHDPSGVLCTGTESTTGNGCPSDYPKCITVGSSNTGTCGNMNCTSGKCLSFASKIVTPIGDIAVTALKVGDIIWTADMAGNRIVRSLIRVSRVPAPNHHVIHLVLVDGRTLDVSALHPTADGRTVGDLTVGDVYDNSIVKSAALKPYEGSATYDILPAGDTGYYWANDILMGSTLK